MIAARRLRDEIRRLLESAAEPDYRDKIAELVPTGSPVLGVRVPVIRRLVRSFAGDHRDLDVEGACDLLDALATDRCREELLFGVFLLARSARKLTRAHWPRLVAWTDCVDNWEVCDQLAKHVAAPIVAVDGAKVAVLERWARGRQPWRRRFALATCAALNQSGRKNVAATLRVCEPVLAESDPVVVKAVGWALREACKHGAPEVYAFLRMHRRHASARILREASAKLAPAQRGALGC